MRAAKAPNAGQTLTGQQSIIKLAILAVGGQGGAVLSGWIVAAAEENGWAVQATSVPGVAQRTGATIYYIEMMPEAEGLPVFALMPSPGDVDIVIAAELMEAGRAVMRGFVTPERTTLIASSHRILAVSEKIAPGDGIADAAGVKAAAQAAARRFIGFDMERIARAEGSIVSASLLGALAGSGALPLPASAFEAAIRSSGRGVEASLRAYRRAREHAASEGAAAAAVTASPQPVRIATPPRGPARQQRQWQALADRVESLPDDARDLAVRGLAKVVDFQDPAYGGEYLDRLERVVAVDSEVGNASHKFALSQAAAKHLANAMAYDDVIRVADRKTRPGRFARIRDDLGLTDGHTLRLTEYLHPRGDEVCSMLPARLGRWVESRPRVFRTLDRFVDRGRRVRSDSILWYATLSAVAGLRRWRRGLLRHERELAHIEDWLERALAMAPDNYGLAVEMLNCRRLIKGYSDTHERGRSKFARVMEMAELLRNRADGADWMRRLRETALKDEKDELLEGAIRTVRSFAERA